MRVSDNHLYGAMTKHISDARERTARAQEVAGSGVRVARPSDDPMAAAAARRENARKAWADAGMKSADLASSQLSGADEALSAVTETLSRAKELAIQGASTTMGADQRKSLAVEIRQLQQNMVVLGNAQVGDAYVFSGFRDDQPPFDASGQYVGDSGVREVTTFPGNSLPASLPGQDAFGAAGDDSIFEVLGDLADALDSNDVNAARSQLTRIEKNEDRVLASRARIGSMMEGVDTLRSVADRYSYQAQTEISRLTDADEVSAITDMLKAKSALDAALAVAQQMPSGGLVKARS